jgi:hypothetical protein
MRYEVQAYLTPQEVIDTAISFFGVDLGLEVQSQGVGLLHFVGGGGHVSLALKDEEPVTVELETREWDAKSRNSWLKSLANAGGDGCGRLSKKSWVDATQLSPPYG